MPLQHCHSPQAALTRAPAPAAACEGGQQAEDPQWRVQVPLEPHLLQVLQGGAAAVGGGWRHSLWEGWQLQRHDCLGGPSALRCCHTGMRCHAGILKACRSGAADCACHAGTPMAATLQKGKDIPQIAAWVDTNIQACAAAAAFAPRCPSHCVRHGCIYSGGVTPTPCCSRAPPPFAGQDQKDPVGHRCRWQRQDLHHQVK